MTGARDGTFVPPETPGGRARRLRRRTFLAAAGLLLAAGAGLVTHEMLTSCGSLGSGVDRVDGMCVGVTDGSYLFHPALEDIQAKIAEENARVRAESSSYVTVALLNLLTPTDISAQSAAQVRSQLEGAYTAQKRINDVIPPTDSTPQIQLVLANQGSTLGQWRPVEDQLVEMTKAEHPLVAVIGLGVSTADTRQRAVDLSQHGIAMVGAITTADGLAYNNIPGLIRVSPSNQDYVKALRNYLDTQDDLGSAMVVYDANSDSGKDLFTKTLKEDLEQQMNERIHFPTQSFVGASIPTDASPGRFGPVTNTICSVSATLDIVFYAGREVDLGGFLTSLADRACQETPLTVMTGGSDIGTVLEEREQRLSAAKLTVVAATATDADGWGPHAPGTPDHYQDFLTKFEELGFDTKDLDNGGAIMMHDALLTAERAVRLAITGDSPPSKADVQSGLLNLNGDVYEVEGASGTLRFSSSSLSGAGNPSGKPIPVLQYPPTTDGPSQQVGPLYVTR